MSVMLISVSYDTVVSNKHEERTRHYYVNFQQDVLLHFVSDIILLELVHCLSRRQDTPTLSRDVTVDLIPHVCTLSHTSVVQLYFVG